MQLRDMTRKKKAKPETAGAPTLPYDDSGEKYPYGLQIRLETEDLDKLGIDIESFSVNDKVSITAVAEITSLSSSKTRNDENQNMQLQITKMDIQTAKTLKSVLEEIKQ